MKGDFCLNARPPAAVNTVGAGGADASCIARRMCRWEPGPEWTRAAAPAVGKGGRMHALDLLAIVALGFGAYIGARKGFWKLAAACSAVGLGSVAGWATCDVLAAALRDWGVGSPGDRIVGFFLPFALTSVYARFIIGLWLARRLEGRPTHNHLLGAAAGIVWMVFVAGSAARISGVADDAPAPARDAYGSNYESNIDASAGAAGPFTKWLARWPGSVGARMYLSAVERGHDEALASTIKETLDPFRARDRAAGADADAINSMREAGFVRLGLDLAPADHP